MNKHSSRTSRSASSHGKGFDPLDSSNDVEPLLDEGGGMFGKFREALVESRLGKAVIAIVGFGALGGVLSGCSSSTPAEASTVKVYSDGFWNGDMHADMNTGTGWDDAVVHLSVNDSCRIDAHTGTGKHRSYNKIDVVEYQGGQREQVLAKKDGGFWNNDTSKLNEGDYELGVERTHHDWGESNFKTVSTVELKVEQAANGQYEVTMVPHGQTDPAPVSKVCTPDYSIGLGL